MAAFDRKLDFLQVPFRDLVGLPRVQQTAQLLDRLETVYDKALDRSYMNKNGDETPNPDLNAAAKCIDCAARLTVFADEAKGGEVPEEQTKPSVAAISGAAERLERSRKSKTAA